MGSTMGATAIVLMGVAILFGALATAVSLVIAPINGDDYYPPMCMIAPKTDPPVCAHYDPIAGQYHPTYPIPGDINRGFAPGRPLYPPRTATDLLVWRFLILSAASAIVGLSVTFLRHRRVAPVLT
jgi:hypothetical protein